MNYLIKTHKPGTIYKSHHTFVLNRGRNTGKVLTQPCANCWVIIADREETIQRLEVIIDSLHVTKRLRPSLIGSVIEYIRIGDFRKTLNLYVRVIGWDDRYTAEIESIRQAKKLLERYELMRNQVQLMVILQHMKLLKGR